MAAGSVGLGTLASGSARILWFGGVGFVGLVCSVSVWRLLTSGCSCLFGFDFPPEGKNEDKTGAPCSGVHSVGPIAVISLKLGCLLVDRQN